MSLFYSSNNNQTHLIRLSGQKCSEPKWESSSTYTKIFKIKTSNMVTLKHGHTTKPMLILPSYKM